MRPFRSSEAGAISDPFDLERFVDAQAPVYLRDRFLRIELGIPV
jgi:hypothetical protein